MSRLIDADMLSPDRDYYENSYNSGYDAVSCQQIDNAPTVKAIQLEKVKKAMEQITDEKEFAYADFDEYKREVLEVEDALDLPDDDFRYGMERCLEILNNLIAESEGK